MDIDTLICTLADYKITLYVENGRLFYQCEKGALQPELRDLIVEKKEQLIAYYNKKYRKDVLKNPIEKAPVNEAGTVLSFSQQRLWFFNEYEKSTVYNIPWAVRLLGPLNITALNHAVNTIVQRHDILRTLYKNIDGQPYQVVAAYKPFNLTVKTIAQSSVADSIQCHADYVFDLARGPLFKVDLLATAQEQHFLLFNVHHIIMDAWSIDILLNELSVLYETYSQRQRNPLPPLGIQYSDYAHWQRQCLQGEFLSALLHYWSEKLDGAMALLPLPTDHPRPAIQSYRGATLDIRLSDVLTQALHDQAQRESVTLFMLLLSSFKLLLYRYTHQQDIITGIPALNRPKPELEPLIGFFANTLVLRSFLDAKITYKALLQQVKATTLEAYDHQDIAFEYLVEKLNPVRSLSYSPLFQVFFTAQDEGGGQFSLANIQADFDTQAQSDTSKFDISLLCSISAQKITIAVEYNTDLFDKSTMLRLADNFTTLLESTTGHVNQRLSELELISAHEKQQLLVTWNNTHTAIDQRLCLLDLFENRVRQTPHAVAVVFADQALTYSGLNEQVNQLACLLLKRYVFATHRAGICLEPSLNTVVSLLAVVKAGLAYVPVNPDFPLARLAFMIEDSHIDILLTQTALLERLPVCRCDVFCLDRHETVGALRDCAPAVAKRYLAAVDKKIQPDALIYIIYTSGSTGQPKGVMLRHSNVSNFIQASTKQLGLHAAERLLAVTPISFDIHVLEIFSPLVQGARLVMAARACTQSARDLARMLIEQMITVMQATPATWNMLHAAGWQCPAALKVLCGGEALSLKLKKALYDDAGVSTLWNMYGPTEACVWSSMALQRNDTDSVSIGSPMANVTYYVLDEYAQPVPVGVAGELYIGGAGLAVGYLNAAQKTAQSFVKNPFSDNAESRLYKTGDLLRWLADGTLEFIDRVDYQIKMRGFRIEPGEIEQALLTYTGVSEAAVVAHIKNDDEKYLVAYLVLQPCENHAAECAFERSALKEAMAALLPDYMVPSHYVVLDAMPLTANGKLDRAALKAPDADALITKAYVAPATAMETMLAGIWSQLLAVPIERIGVNDNFFALGGNSLLMVKMASEIESALGVELPLFVLFQNPVIKRLAQQIA